MRWELSCLLIFFRGKANDIAITPFVIEIEKFRPAITWEKAFKVKWKLKLQRQVERDSGSYFHHDLASGSGLCNFFSLAFNEGIGSRARAAID